MGSEKVLEVFPHSAMVVVVFLLVTAVTPRERGGLSVVIGVTLGEGGGLSVVMVGVVVPLVGVVSIGGWRTARLGGGLSVVMVVRGRRHVRRSLWARGRGQCRSARRRYANPCAHCRRWSPRLRRRAGGLLWCPAAAATPAARRAWAPRRRAPGCSAPASGQTLP